MIYSKLIEARPSRYMTLEAAYPMPILGTYLKKHAPGFYSHGQIGSGGINIFDSITAGFRCEPWAVSMFFGNITNWCAPEKRAPAATSGIPAISSARCKAHQEQRAHRR